MNLATRLKVFLHILTLVPVCFIRSTHSAFPFYEIRPPKGKILIFSNDSKAEILLEINDQPALHSVLDTTRTIEGYIVNADPRDACGDVAPPPPTISDNLTWEWILLAQKQDCSYQNKITNAFAANYAAILIYNVESNETEVIGDEGNFILKIPAFFIGKWDGRLLLQNFSYPNLFYVQIQKAEIFWEKLTAYCVWIAWTLGTVGFISVLLYFTIRTIVRNCAVLRTLLRPIEKCGICYEALPLTEGYDLMSRVNALPCLHKFHAFCMLPYATVDGMACPSCDKIFEFNGQQDSEGPCSSTSSLQASNTSQPRRSFGFQKRNRDKRPLILNTPQFIQKTA